MFKNYIILFVLLGLFGLNYFVFGFGFWYRPLDFLFSLLPFVLLILLIVNSFIFFKDVKALSVFSIIFSVYLLFFLFICEFLNAPLKYVDQIVFNDKVVVYIYADYSSDSYVFIQKNEILYMFSKKQCVYWFKQPPQYKDYGIAEKHDDSLLVYDTPKGTSIPLNNVGSKCSCENSFGESYDVCIFDDALLIPFELIRYFIFGY